MAAQDGPGRLSSGYNNKAVEVGVAGAASAAPAAPTSTALFF